MKHQRRYHITQSLKTFLVGGDRHDDIDRSADTAEKKDSAQYI